MSTLSEEKVLRINSPGYGVSSTLPLGEAKPLAMYDVIVANPVSIAHLFESKSELLTKVENLQNEGITTLRLDDDEFMESTQSELDLRTQELAQFIRKGSLLVFFLTPPFTVQCPSGSMDNYSWLGELAPDKPAGPNHRNMSATIRGKSIDVTADGAKHVFQQYLKQPGLEWSTIIRNENLTEGFVPLATAGPNKCIAAFRPTGHKNGMVVFLPAPYAERHDLALSECLRKWADLEEGGSTFLEPAAPAASSAGSDIKIPLETVSQSIANTLDNLFAEDRSPVLPMQGVTNKDKEESKAEAAKDREKEQREEEAPVAKNKEKDESKEESPKDKERDDEPAAKQKQDSKEEAKEETKKETKEFKEPESKEEKAEPTSSAKPAESSIPPIPQAAEPIESKEIKMPEPIKLDPIKIDSTPEPAAAKSELAGGDNGERSMGTSDNGATRSSDSEGNGHPQAKDLMKKMQKELSKPNVPAWCQAYSFAELDALRQQFEDLQEQVRLANLKMQDVQERIQMMDDLKNSLLSAQGDELLRAVTKVFGHLGWSVKPSANSSDELWLTDGTQTQAIVRLVWTTGQPNRAELAHLAESLINFWGAHEYEPKGILLASTWADRPPIDRTEEDYTTSMIEFAERKNLSLLTTTQLLSIFRDLVLGGGVPSKVREVIVKTSGAVPGYELELSESAATV
jgi:hypothetical protein